MIPLVDSLIATVMNDPLWMVAAVLIVVAALSESSTDPEDVAGNLVWYIGVAIAGVVAGRWILPPVIDILLGVLLV